MVDVFTATGAAAKTPDTTSLRSAGTEFLRGVTVPAACVARRAPRRFRGAEDGAVLAGAVP